jgi:integrase
MRHVNYTLKPPTIDNAKPRDKAYSLTDGGGLQIEVLPSGSKTWRFKYHLNGKSELLRSKWPEFDLDAAQWDIPAERMKMGKAHRVFLSRQAVDILRQVHEFTGQREYVFPSIFRGNLPMGDVTLNHFFKRIDFGVPEFSPHGLRGTAATLLREHGFGRDVVELLHWLWEGM